MVIPIVKVSTLPVADLRQEDVIHHMRSLVGADRISTAFGVHVLGLISKSDTEYARGVAESDIAYADGISIVLLARIAGAKRVTRAPLTDIGHGLLAELRESLPDLRVALIGGPPGLAEAAADVLARLHGVIVCYTTHGFHDAWHDRIKDLSNTRPDVVFVGLGTPREVQWIGSHRTHLPPALYVTVGGWFGHLTGQERRAPRLLQKAGFEWFWRMVQRPRDLVPRYLRGAIAVLREIPAALQSRWRT